jgi:hypothetical protein
MACAHLKQFPTPYHFSGWTASPGPRDGAGQCKPLGECLEKIMKTFSDDNLYGSGLNRKDWYLFCNILLPFLHAQNIREIEIPVVPEHLRSHVFMEAIQSFKITGNKEFLDKAGKCLIPSSKIPFEWYVAVTKA